LQDGPIWSAPSNSANGKTFDFERFFSLAEILSTDAHGAWISIEKARIVGPTQGLADASNSYRECRS